MFQTRLSCRVMKIAKTVFLSVPVVSANTSSDSRRSHLPPDHRCHGTEVAPDQINIWIRNMINMIHVKGVKKHLAQALNP